MSLTIPNPIWNTLFSVPNAVVDQYLKLATPSQLKVLLYCLRHQPETIDSEQIGKQVGCSAEITEEALLFWQQTDLFSAAPNIISQSVQITPQAVQNETPPPTPPEQTVERHKIPSSSVELKLLPSEIAEMVEKSESLHTLFNMVQQQYGRILNHVDHRSLIWMHDYLNFSNDVILTAISYCKSIGIYNVRYVERILTTWCDDGITTLQQAQEEIKYMEERRTYQYKIKKMLEMHRNPTPKQQAFIDDWREKAVPMDLIRYAYEKTVENTDRLSFSYMQKMIDSWMKAGYKTRNDVDLYDKPPEKKSVRKRKKEEIPVSENAEAYQSLIYNLDE